VRIAIITEGVSEYRNLPQLYEQICAGSPHQVVQTLKINVSPDAPPPVVARESKSRLLVAARSGAQCAIVILDRENQTDCPGLIATQIEAALNRACGGAILVRVVLKDRAFENWLIADLDALEAQPKRFKVAAAARRKVESNKADVLNGTALIKSVVVGGHYDKVADSQRICARMDVLKAASHSRSFRHLLHVFQHPQYAHQCRRP
jgi:hypothetical protein